MRILRNLQCNFLDVWNLAWLFWLCRICMASCPLDVQTYTTDCFGIYNTNLDHIQMTDQTFFLGVHIEDLRLLCSSYQAAVRCVRKLHDQCSPEKHNDIRVALISLENTQTEPSQLCKDDNMFDVYARSQSCFTTNHDYSERCFKISMGMNVSSINQVTNKPLNQFCSELKSLNTCISNNTQLKCGKEAKSLVDVLIRASIKRSTECDNIVPLSQASSPDHNGQNSNSGSCLWKNYIHRTLLLCLIFLILKHSIRL